MTLATAAVAYMINPASAHDAVARYIANEGIAVSHDGNTILFDAFYDEGFGQYAVPDSQIQNKILHGTSPYEGIIAVFISHVHGDHFSPEPTIEFLRKNPSVVLFGPEQVREAFLDAGVNQKDKILSRLRTYSITPEDDPISADFGDLFVEAVSIPHSGNRPHIQNYSWRVTLGDEITVMHFGDADTAVSNFSRHFGYFKSRVTHAAFPPYWFLSDRSGKLVLKDIISAGQVIGIHVPKRAAGNGNIWREQYGGDLFTDPGETRTISDGITP